MQIEDLDLDVRTYNAVKRTGCDTVEELRQMLAEDPDNVRRSLGSRTFGRIVEMLSETEEKNMIEITTKLPPAPAEPTTPEYLAAFNLNARIHYCKDSVERGLAEMCIGIEQMRGEKQYKALGYQNFEDYCQQEFGFSRVQGTKYADVGKMLKDQNVNSSLHFEDLGINKLALLAKLDEPTREVLTEAVDVENATVKELKAQITALQRDKDKLEGETADLGQRLDLAEEKLSKSERQTKAKQDELDDLRAGNKRRYDTLMTKIRTLQEQLAEAQSEKEQVAVEDTSRVEELEKQLAECKRQLEERPMVQEALPGDGGERRRGEYSAISNAVVNALEDLMDFLEDNDHCRDFHYFASRAKEKLREYNNKVNDMLAKEETSCL